MRGQRAAVGLARTSFTFPPGLRLIGGLDLSQCGLDFLKAELKLVGIELLGTATELVALQRLDNRPQTLDLSLRGRECVELAGLLKHYRAQAINVIWEVRFHEHGCTESARESRVNRQFAGLLDASRHAPAASPDPRSKWPVGLLSGASHRPGFRAT